MKTILVKAAPLADPALAGKARVVREGTTRRYITEDKAMEVNETPYYLRKINRGELVRVEPKRPQAKIAPKKAEG